MNDQYNNRYSCPIFNKELKQELLYDLPKELNSTPSTSASVTSMPDNVKSSTSTSQKSTLSHSSSYRAHETTVASSSKQTEEGSSSVNIIQSNQKTKNPPTSFHGYNIYSSDSELECPPIHAQISPSSSFSSNSKRNSVLRNRPRPIPLNLSGSIRSFSDAPKSSSFSKRWKKGAPTPPGTPTKHHFVVRGPKSKLKTAVKPNPGHPSPLSAKYSRFAQNSPVTSSFNHESSRPVRRRHNSMVMPHTKEYERLANLFGWRGEEIKQSKWEFISTPSEEDQEAKTKLRVVNPWRKPSKNSLKERIFIPSSSHEIDDDEQSERKISISFTQFDRIPQRVNGTSTSQVILPTARPVCRLSFGEDNLDPTIFDSVKSDDSPALIVWSEDKSLANVATKKTVQRRFSVGNNATRLLTVSESRKTIMFATLEKLIENLTVDIDYGLLTDFFLTYRSFASPLKLCRLLILRYQWALLEDTQERWIVRIRLFVVLRHWVINYFSLDFLTSRELRETLANYLLSLTGSIPVLRSPRDQRVVFGLLRIMRSLTVYYRYGVPPSDDGNTTFIADGIEEAREEFWGIKIPEEEELIGQMASFSFEKSSEDLCQTEGSKLRKTESEPLFKETQSKDDGTSLLRSVLLSQQKQKDIGVEKSKKMLMKQFSSASLRRVRSVLKGNPEKDNKGSTKPNAEAPSNQLSEEAAFSSVYGDLVVPSTPQKDHQSKEEVFPHLQTKASKKFKFGFFSSLRRHKKHTSVSPATTPEMSPNSSANSTPYSSLSVSTVPSRVSAESLFEYLPTIPAFEPLQFDQKVISKSPSPSNQEDNDSDSDNDNSSVIIHNFDPIATTEKKPSHPEPSSVNLPRQKCQSAPPASIAQLPLVIPREYRTKKRVSLPPKTSFGFSEPKATKLTVRRSMSSYMSKNKSPSWGKLHTYPKANPSSADVTRAFVTNTIGKFARVRRAVHENLKHKKDEDTDSEDVECTGCDYCREYKKNPNPGKISPQLASNVKDISENALGFQQFFQGESSIDQTSMPTFRATDLDDAIKAGNDQPDLATVLDPIRSTPTENSKTFSSSVVPPKNFVARTVPRVLTKRQPRPFILKYRSEILAQNFTLIERDILNGVVWEELIKWSKNAGQKKSILGIQNLIERFNQTCQWVVSEIVATRDISMRAKVIEKFIRIALKCYQHRNFATVTQLTLGLQNPVVDRLHKTWSRVGLYELRLLADLERFTQPFKNWKHIREAMHVISEDWGGDGGGEESVFPSETPPSTAIGGCIPFLGLFLSDLVYNSELPSTVEPESPGSSHLQQSTVENGEKIKLVNFHKFRTCAKIIKRVLAFQTLAQRYQFQYEPVVYSKCLNLHCLDNVSVRILSTECEP
ncbi:Guanine nucleotide exchange factor lte1 [Basidiobolus ranarum]|uniref:Guanine nucleotide exchange factor lte1 n=1 Tax=Basidiobolus ranarum TaxID=34480 RepID=A0ABR2WW60_9FUNG